jgi:hypothetical protein
MRNGIHADGDVGHVPAVGFIEWRNRSFATEYTDPIPGGVIDAAVVL